MNSTAYERRRVHRDAQRQRALMGETLAQFHERENPTRTALGDRLPRARCKATDDLFSPTSQLFDKITKEA